METNPNPAQTDPDLLCGTLADAHRIFRQEILPHIPGPALKYYALKYAGGRTEYARSLLHETIVHAYFKIRSYQPGTNALAWLITIMRSIHCQHVRKRQVRLKYMDIVCARLGYLRNVENHRFSEVPLSFNPRCYAHLVSDRMLCAMLQLTPRQFAPFVLYALHDYPYEDIAALLDIPMGTVKSRISRARNIMKECLAEA